VRFEVEKGIPKPDGLPWQPGKKKRESWPFVYMRVGECFDIADEDIARLVYSRMNNYLERHSELDFEIHEIVSGELYRCFRTA
jgi:hypothetical protein